MTEMFNPSHPGLMMRLEAGWARTGAAMRVWRLCFAWRDGHAQDVEMVDYH